MGTAFTQDVEEGAEEQILEPTRCGRLRPGGMVGMCVVVAPGPWNDIEETPKSWALGP